MSWQAVSQNLVLASTTNIENINKSGKKISQHGIHHHLWGGKIQFHFFSDQEQSPTNLLTTFATRLAKLMKTSKSKSFGAKITAHSFFNLLSKSSQTFSVMDSISSCTFL